MSEQIVDLIEAVMPGPRGLTGPQGPVRSGVVPEDEAVAGLVSASSSATAGALDLAVPARSGVVRLLVFGDSWTAYYGQQLPSAIASKLHAAWWKCYGVSGAKMGDIAQQIAQAGADESFDNATVTHVVIVGGTNNIFDPGQGSDSATLRDQAADVVDNLTAYYPHARCHYFPDNSRTANGGRTGGYFDIVQQFCQFSDVVCHPETLWLLAYGNFEFYRTDSTNRENLQHLTRNGYDWLAGYIAACVRGGDTTRYAMRCTSACDFQYRADYLKAVSPDSEYEFIGDLKIYGGAYTSTMMRITYDGGMTQVSLQLAGLAWTAKGVPQSTQRYALLDLQTYPISADTAAFEYAQYKTNLTIPPVPVTGHGVAWLGTDGQITDDASPVLPVTGTLAAGEYGSLRMRVFADKGDTTSPWPSFNRINLDYTPYRNI